MGAGKIKPKVFPNRRDQYPELLHWLERNTGESPQALHVYLEATSPYHEPLAYWLHEQGVRVYVLNPAQVRFHAQGMGVRNKTDRKDSMMLARYGIERTRAVVAGTPRGAGAQAAFGAVTAAHHNADVRAQYQRLLRRGKAKVAAIGAAMSKLLHIAFGVLKSQQPYQPRCSTG
nr:MULTISPECIES: IS110 family transposase [unclassified Thioalkalivibrio]